MHNLLKIGLLYSFLGLISCQSEAPKNAAPRLPTAVADTIRPGTDTVVFEKTKGEPAEAMPDDAEKSSETASQSPAKRHGLDPLKWADVKQLDSSIVLDIRYATTNNFTKSKIYDCPACYLRPEAAKALVEANRALKKRGFRLKMFDCYRPRPYQQRLWDKVPNPDYVTPPQKGSMHSRGAAVDLTIVDANGKELDMGTPYDFFGIEAHADYLKHPAPVLENRKLLAETLRAVGFEGIRTEWWHFSFKKSKFDLSNEVWECR